MPRPRATCPERARGRAESALQTPIVRTTWATFATPRSACARAVAASTRIARAANGVTIAQHVCSPKLPNGTPLPGDPERVAKCSTDVGQERLPIRDLRSARRQLRPGAGRRTLHQLRRNAASAVATRTPSCARAACTSDADCSTTEYCDSNGACTERLPVGSQCSDSNQCQTHDCTAKVCSSLVASGAGVACATRAVGGSACLRAPACSWR